MNHAINHMELYENIVHRKLNICVLLHLSAFQGSENSDFHKISIRNTSILPHNSQWRLLNCPATFQEFTYFTLKCLNPGCRFKGRIE